MSSGCYRRTPRSASPCGFLIKLETQAGRSFAGTAGNRPRLNLMQNMQKMSTSRSLARSPPANRRKAQEENVVNNFATSPSQQPVECGAHLNAYTGCFLSHALAFSLLSVRVANEGGPGLYTAVAKVGPVSSHRCCSCVTGNYHFD